MAKRRALPEITHCRNCDTALKGEFCHNCGQKRNAGRGVPVVALVWNALQNAFALDGKTPRTLAALLFCPGRLSDAYRRGKIASYVHPVKFFWMTVLIFVVLLVARMDAGYTAGTLFDSGNTTEQTNVDKPSYDRMRNAVATYMPYVTIAMIPVFALMLALFFRRSRYFYMHHMVFALHLHTFIMMVVCAVMGATMVFPGTWPEPVRLLILMLPAVYFVIAAHRFYHSVTRAGTIVRSAAIIMLYAAILLTITVCLLVAWADTLE